ncbi:Multidrug resistance protein 1, partial [Rhizophlyctis rosea]
MAPAGRIHPSEHDDVAMDDPVDPTADVEAPPLLGVRAEGPRKVSLWGLWRFATKWELAMILFACLTSMVTGIINPLAIRILGDLLAGFLAGASGAVGTNLSDVGNLYEKSRLFAWLGLGAFGATYISRALWVLTAEQQINRISLRYLECVLRQEMEFFDRSEGDSPTARLQNDIALIRNGIGETAGALFATLGTMTTTLIISFWTGWKLTLIFRMVSRGEEEGTDVVVILLSMMMLAASLMNVPGCLSTLARAQAAAVVIYDTIARQSDMDDDRRDQMKPNTLAGDISFQNVCFSYPSRPHIPILQGLSIDIRAGQTVAFVGGSGSGKSTTISLLQRFYSPSAGSVSIDGFDVESLDLATLRKHIGVVGQEPVLFSLTIKQNILLGTQESVSPARFLEVCKMAQCHEFVSKFPLGYDTPVAAGMLSGGQKQRVAIARAMIKNPKILLLDEATSALDTNSERLVQRALDAAAAGRTTIVIAHRLSTVRNADVICVMDKGRLIEKGTHEELYNRNGMYTQLVDKQSLFVNKNGGNRKDEAVVEYPEVTSVTAPEYEKNDQIRKMMDEEVLVMDGAEYLAREGRLRLKEEKLRRKLDARDGPSGVFWKVFKMMKYERRQIVFGTLAAGLDGVVFPGFALILGFTVGEIMTPSQSAVNMWIGFMLVVAIFALLGRWAQNAMFGRANAQLTRRLRLAVFENLLRQEIGFFDAKANSVGILCNKLGAASRVPLLVTDVWGGLAQLSFTAVYGVGLSCAFEARLAGILLILAPFLLLASYWQSTSLSKFAESSKDAQEQASSVALEAIREVKTLKMLGREGFAVERYEASLAKPYKLSRRNAIVDSIAYALQATAAMFTICLGLYAGQRLMESAAMELWRLIVVVLGMTVTMMSIAGSAGLASALAQGRFAARETLAMLERKTLINPDTPGVVPPYFKSGFEFRNLVFQYPTSTEPIFKGEFSLAGQENKSLALVGPSGCGKSTVIGLLQRWYEPLAGISQIGGTAIKDYDLFQGLRANMALVGQEPVLFDMSIAENIAWGSENVVTMEEIVAAAMQANVHSFVDLLPEGYNTRVGDRGGHLSGGQKQRIAIARALIRKPKLLLLDEATSALDSTSEVEVQRAIDQAAAGRTTVTIAHR